MKNISDKVCRENQNTYFMFNTYFFPKNRDVYEMMWENMGQPNRPQTKIYSGACALHAGYLRLQTHIQYT